MKKKRFFMSLLFLITGVVLGFFSFSKLVPANYVSFKTVTPVLVSQKKTSIHYTALGDSLTEGIGDTTKQGGFVGILGKDLTDHYQVTSVTVDNFGKNGDRSDQMLKRLKKSQEQQDSLQQADLITLTVGGNDLMKIIRNDLFKQLTVESFKKPGETYQKNLKALIDEIRKYSDSPIYLMGIYNPFYVYFSQMDELEDIVSYWNELTMEVMGKYPKIYFVSSSELLSKGSQSNVENAANQQNESGTADSSEEKDFSAPPKAVTNQYISDEDNFHPNRVGYQLIAQAFDKKLQATQSDWLQKDR